MICVTNTVAQELYCAQEETPWTKAQKAAIEASSINVPTSGQYRALVVFVRFKDDDYDTTCDAKWNAWASSATLPSNATAFLEEATAGGEAPDPEYIASTMTNYFYKQSDHSFVLYGEPYEEVVVTQRDEADYGIVSTSIATQDSMAVLTEEVLDN